MPAHNAVNSVLLINPPARKRLDQYDSADFPNPTIAYLAAYLLRHDISCKVLDAKLLRLDFESILGSQQLKEAGIIGITSMTHEINTSGKLAARIKERFREKRIIIGGPHATALPEETLRDFPAIDFLVYGEGEKPLAQLINALMRGESSQSIRGVSFRLNGKLVINTDEDRIEEVDEIPAPAYELFPRCRRYYLLTARGCIYRCPYCYHKRQKVRFRSAKRVAAELKALVDNYSPEVITITDDTFNADKSRMIEILDLMIADNLRKNTEFKATVHARNLDYDILCRMREAGFRIIHLGIESGNERILHQIGKGINKEMIRQAVSAARRANIAIQGLYILGHPDETLKTALDTVKFAVQLNTEEIAVAVMVPYPGTQIWEYALNNQHGYKNLSTDWERYSKYFGPAVRFEHLSEFQLFLLQAMAYLGLYMCHLRFIALFRFLLSFRKEASSFALTIINRVFSRRSDTSILRS